MRFKMFKKMRIENRFEDFSNSRSKGNRTIVGGIRAVTFLWSRMNQRVLPRFRVKTGFECEAKKATKYWSNLTANSLRYIGKISSLPDALFVLREENNLPTLRGEKMIGGTCLLEGFRRRIRSIGIIDSRIS